MGKKIGGERRDNSGVEIQAAQKASFTFVHVTSIVFRTLKNNCSETKGYSATTEGCSLFPAEPVVNNGRQDNNGR